MATSWKCSFCNHDAVIDENSRTENSGNFFNGNKYGNQQVTWIAITCPNPECKEYSLSLTVSDEEYRSDLRRSVHTQRHNWQLVPSAHMKQFPEYVPAPIIADYKEACLIKELSPKASATISRRCLQGMIRDFWGISKGTLVDEIEALTEKVDPTTWNAIDAIRKIGNIGAHMEKDINLIIDVDPDEAALLIGLVEMLINDWYVVKHEREQQMAKLIALAQDKANQKNNSATTE